MLCEILKSGLLFSFFRQTYPNFGDSGNEELENNVAERIEALQLYVVDANLYKIKLANKVSGFKPDRLEDSTCYGLTRNCSEPCNEEDNFCPLVGTE